MVLSCAVGELEKNIGQMIEEKRSECKNNFF